MSDCCNHKQKLPDHSDQNSRLNRVSGQISAIKQMIADKRYCPEIMMQLRAVRSAIKSIEANLLERHLESCVSETLQQDADNHEKKKKKIDELINLFKKNDEF